MFKVGILRFRIVLASFLVASNSSAENGLGKGKLEGSPFRPDLGKSSHHPISPGPNHHGSLFGLEEGRTSGFVQGSELLFILGPHGPRLSSVQNQR